MTRPPASHVLRGLLLAASLASAGCLEVREEIAIDEDGSGRITLDVLVEEEALRVAGRGDPSAVPEAFLATVEGLRRRAERIDGVTRFDGRHVRGTGRHRFVVQLALDDMAHLADVQSELYDPDASTDGEPAEPDLRIGRLRNGNVVFLQSFGDCQGVGGSRGDAGSVLARVAAQVALADAHAIVVLRGPGIVSANGAVDPDRRSVTWEVPLADLVAGRAETVELRAEVAMGGTAWPWIGLIVFVALAAGMAAVWVQRRRQPERWRSG